MKKLFLIGICLFLTSCKNQIEVKNNNIWEKENISTNQKNQEKVVSGNKIYPWIKTCWIITCALQEYLEKQELDWKFNIWKTKYIQNRFSSLIDRFSNKDTLVKTDDFKSFVKDFHKEFFSWDLSYSYDEKNYIWYIFLPKMVNEEYVEKRSLDWQDAESIVQAIKEKYFLDFEQKEAIIQVYKDDLVERIKNIDFGKIDKNKLKIDNAYFEQIILKPQDGLYDQVFQNITSIIWPERWQLRKLTVFTADLFFSKLKELWISKDEFFKNIWTSKDVFKKIETKTKQMNSTYWLSTKIPYDRYIRHDEKITYIFNNLEEFNKKWNFNKDTLELRHLILLQYSFPDEKLYNMPERVAQFDSASNFMTEDLYTYSKSLNNIKY